MVLVIVSEENWQQVLGNRGPLTLLHTFIAEGGVVVVKQDTTTQQVYILLTFEGNTWTLEI